MINPFTGEKTYLKPDEIECRVGNFSKDKKWFTILLYKTARIDQQVLDNVFGAFNWTSRHYEVKGKDFCEVCVRNPETGEWVCKSDCGSESNIESEKGEASDSFKRACVQWGIGRELYYGPKISVSAEEVSQYDLDVKEIEYDENGKVSYLSITGKNLKTNKFEEVFTWPRRKAITSKPQTSEPKQQEYDWASKKPISFNPYDPRLAFRHLSYHKREGLGDWLKSKNIDGYDKLTKLAYELCLEEILNVQNG